MVDRTGIWISKPQLILELHGEWAYRLLLAAHGNASDIIEVVHSIFTEESRQPVSELCPKGCVECERRPIRVIGQPANDEVVNAEKRSVWAGKIFNVERQK